MDVDDGRLLGSACTISYNAYEVNHISTPNWDHMNHPIFPDNLLLSNHSAPC